MKPIIGAGHVRAGAAATTPRRRKPSMRSLIKQAERSGKNVTSATIDGMTLHFGTPTNDEVNEWDRDLLNGKH